MGNSMLWLLLVGALALTQASASDGSQSAAYNIQVNASRGRKMPDTLFGIFFEEINHAGAGGLWAELVSNRGFEAGGQHSPSCIQPWGSIGDRKSIDITTELTSCFERNKVALRMDVHCDQNCPQDGVGVYNPGYGGMNIEKGNGYNVVFYVRASGSLNIAVSFTSSNGSQVLATKNIVADEVQKWTKMQLELKAHASNTNARLQLTTTSKGTIWLDQVSAMPIDTYKGHGYRMDLMKMLLGLKPRFLRFPGGCYVQGNRLMNAFRWKETVGPWEERSGHYGDVWNYWSDDGLGYLEYLQLAEDIGAIPVWVINIGFGLEEEVDTSLVEPFVQEMLDSIEFARGDSNSTWGSVRAAMGHPNPFDLKYIALGNEDCGKPNYRGNYLRFHEAVKRVYPDIKVISNCDGSTRPLDHPADLFDFHTYTSPEGMLANVHKFDKQSRAGPKVFVSEYAVTDPGVTNDNGTLIGAISEAAFLIGLERNSDVVEMASYAPLFGYLTKTQWNPDAIYFNSWRAYGIPSYYMQTFFIESSGATLLDADVDGISSVVIASAIIYLNKENNKNYIKIKVVNFQDSYCNVSITLEGLDAGTVKGSKQTVLTSDNVSDQNSMANSTKVVPKVGRLVTSGKHMDAVLHPYSLTAFDWKIDSKRSHQGRKLKVGKKH